MCMAAFAVLFIGLSKAGFGGGLGMLTTPICVMAFGPKDAIGILLPLLCAGDAFSLYHYWKKWEVANFWFLLPGILVGVLIGSRLVGHFSARQLNLIIGLMSVGFVLFQVLKEQVFRRLHKFTPTHKNGFPFGVGAGLTSTFAHGAGPVVTMYLMPQQMPKEVYVATTVMIFTWINWIKMPFFIGNGIITWDTARWSIAFLPLIPVGVWIGVWLNRKVSDKVFTKIVYVMTFFTGLHLIYDALHVKPH